MNDIYNLQRFVDEQERVYLRVCAELADGHKTSHWIWFIFPQIAGLGTSEMSQRFSISSLAEAQAYLAHRVLAPRLRHCTRLVIDVEGRSALQIFGDVDRLKFCSCMTLFAKAGANQDNQIFLDALAKYYGGEFDRLTIEKI